MPVSDDDSTNEPPDPDAPRLFTKETLNLLLEKLAPLSKDKQNILVSELREMNLIQAPRKSARVRQSGKRTRYDKLDDSDEDDDGGFYPLAKRSIQDPDFVGEDDQLEEKFRRIITISLNCPIEVCGVICKNKNELDDHLLAVHQVKKHRCLAMGCTASFDQRYDLFGPNLKHLV